MNVLIAEKWKEPGRASGGVSAGVPVPVTRCSQCREELWGAGGYQEPVLPIRHVASAGSWLSTSPLMPVGHGGTHCVSIPRVQSGWIAWALGEGARSLGRDFRSLPRTCLPTQLVGLPCRIASVLMYAVQNKLSLDSKLLCFILKINMRQVWLPWGVRSSMRLNTCTHCPLSGPSTFPPSRNSLGCSVP